MSAHDQKPARPGRRSSDSHEDFDPLVDAQDEPWFRQPSPGDPGTQAPAERGDREATPGQDLPPSHHELPEQHQGADHGGLGETLGHFIDAVGNLLGSSEEALGHLFSTVGNLIGAWLEAHGDLD